MAGTVTICLGRRTAAATADNTLGYRHTSGPIVVNGRIVAGMTGCERYKDGTCFISAHDPQTGAELCQRALKCA